MRAESASGFRAAGLGTLRWALRVIPTMIYLSLLTVTGWLLYYSLASQYYAVKEIAVSGNRLLDADQAREATGALGRNVLLLRPKGIEQSVRKISVVKEAQAALALPGRVRVDVAERTPLATWQGRGGYFLVDREGVVFSRQESPNPVPAVRDLDGPAMEVGNRVDPSVLAAIDTLERALPQQPGLRPLGFDYSRSSGITVPTEEGPRVIFGDASDLDSKLATLVALRQQLEATKARVDVIDLRFKGRPLYVLSPPANAKPAAARQ